MKIKLFPFLLLFILSQQIFADKIFSRGNETRVARPEDVIGTRKD